MSNRSDEELKRDLSARLAKKLEDIPKSMAWILGKYRETEGVDESAVARYLGIDVDQLHELARFGRPRQYLFEEDIETISERFGIDKLVLASFVRHVEVVETFRYHSEAGSDQIVAAARDVAEDRESYDAESDKPETAPTEPEDEQ